MIDATPNADGIVAATPVEPWTDVFGTFQATPPPVVISEPEAAPVRHDFILKGLFAGPTNSWAIVADQAGEYLLRAGDELPNGVVVSSITRQGVWLETVQGRALIAFDD